MWCMGAFFLLVVMEEGKRKPEELRRERKASAGFLVGFFLSYKRR